MVDGCSWRSFTWAGVAVCFPFFVFIVSLELTSFSSLMLATSPTCIAACTRDTPSKHCRLAVMRVRKDGLEQDSSKPASQHGLKEGKGGPRKGNIRTELFVHHP